VERSAIGEALTVNVNRNGKEETLTVRPGKFPTDD